MLTGIYTRAVQFVLSMKFSVHSKNEQFFIYLSKDKSKPKEQMQLRQDIDEGTNSTNHCVNNARTPNDKQTMNVKLQNTK